MSTDHAPTGKNTHLRADAERLADIFTSMQRDFVLHLSDALIRGHVSFAQYLLLGFLAQQGDPPTMTEISRKMCHTTAAATGLVDRLEKLGYARRQVAPRDRRRVYVLISAKGRELVSRVREDMIGNVMRLMGFLDEGEQHAWLRIYEKIFPHYVP